MKAQSTHWTVIQAAAEGDDVARAEFVRCYEPVVRTFLGWRWDYSAHAPEVDDAVQEVFLACFQENGALTRVDPSREGGFQAFLYGVTKNIARRFEAAWRHARKRGVRSGVDLDRIESDEETISSAFDRALASMLLSEAARLQAVQAAEKGGFAPRRVELLSLRFQDDLPIREIATRWDVEADWLHHQYAQAREEFKRALRDVVRDHRGGNAAHVEEECARLLQLF